MTVFRSALFMIWFLFLTVVMAIIFLPLLACPAQSHGPDGALLGPRHALGPARFAGIGERQIGEAPQGGVLVASKHMSMWDTLALYLALDDPGIVLKRELLRIPFYGWYLGKAAAIPIDRSAGADALRRMTRAAQSVLAQGRPILIFPKAPAKSPARRRTTSRAWPDFIVCWASPACRWRWIPGATGKASSNIPAPSAFSSWNRFRRASSGPNS